MADQNETKTTYNNKKTFGDIEAVAHLNYVAYGVIMPIICSFGVVGNFLNLIILTRPNLKAVTYLYLRAMAVADFISMPLTVPFILKSAEANLTTYYAAWYSAHLDLALSNSFIGIGVLSTVAVTVDRYICVCFPLQAKSIQNVTVAKLIILFVSITPFIFYIPMCFAMTVVSVDNTTYDVQENVPYTSTNIFHIYTWIRESVLRLGPILLLVVLNVRIMSVFRKVVKRRQMLQNRKEISKFKEDQRLIVLLISIVLLFFCCTLPASILFFLYSPAADTELYSFQLFRAAANLLETANYALNFYIYCLCSSEFRKTFLATFCCARQVHPMQIDLLSSGNLR